MRDMHLNDENVFLSKYSCIISMYDPSVELLYKSVYASLSVRGLEAPLVSGEQSDMVSCSGDPQTN